MKMSVGMLDHYNVSTRKLDETVNFYENVLGFTNGPRPPFNFPGAWLYSSGHPVTTKERDQALGTRGTILSASRRGRCAGLDSGALRPIGQRCRSQRHDRR